MRAVRNINCPRTKVFSQRKNLTRESLLFHRTCKFGDTSCSKIANNCARRPSAILTVNCDNGWTVDGVWKIENVDE